MEKGLLLYGCIALVVTAVMFIFAFIYNIIAYPLSGQAVYDDMEHKNVIAYKEEQGVWVYITESGDEHTVYILSESIFLNRYRYYAQREYTDTFITAVPGKRFYIILDITGSSIQLMQGEARRLNFGSVFSFILIIVSITNLVFHKNKRKTERRQG